MIVITGQTATGKTTLALKEAEATNGELVNADSRQIYKGLDIVTGKDIQQIRDAGIAYHMIDIVDPTVRYSSHEYAAAAGRIIADIRRRGKTPIIVGGTYLYIKHLIYGFDVSIPPNESLRTSLINKSVEQLQEMLSPRPSDINDSDWNNPRRLIRRIEIRVADPIIRAKNTPYGNGEYSLIGLRHQGRSHLESAIKSRVDARMQAGALEEVRSLLGRGYTKHDPGLQTIGYKQLIACLEGTRTQEDAIEEWVTKEVQYAKRQLTFMKTDHNISWQL